MAGVIGTRSVEDSHVPGMPATDMAARNGEPPSREVYQRRVSRCRSGRCRTYDPDPDLLSTNPSAASSRTASTATRSDTSYWRASSYRLGIFAPGGSTPSTMERRRSSAMRWYVGAGTRTSLTKVSTQVQAEYSALFAVSHRRARPWRPQSRSPGLPAMVLSARRFVRGILGHARSAEDMELITAELVSNAIRHTPSGQDGGGVHVNGPHRAGMGAAGGFRRGDGRVERPA